MALARTHARAHLLERTPARPHTCIHVPTPTPLHALLEPSHKFPPTPPARREDAVTLGGDEEEEFAAYSARSDEQNMSSDKFQNRSKRDARKRSHDTR